MIRETELNLFVPSPELLVLLASGERPLGVRAGPPRIRHLKETYFDTPDQALRRRGMTCKLRQEEGGEPDVVVTLGEDPDAEGITSRLRLTASAVGFGLFETLRGDSEPAIQIQKIVDPGKLRPQIALEIQRLGRVYRKGLLRRPALLLYFDRITVRAGGVSAVFHELRIRRRRKGGPTIEELSLHLRDCHHLFPDGLSTLQRAYRILSMEGKMAESDLSPYALSLAWAAFWNGRLALRKKDTHLCIPTFRGSGEDAARALSTDILGAPDLQLVRLGTTEPRAGRPVVELWTAPDTGLTDEELSSREHLVWFPWHDLLEEVGREDLQDPVLVSALVLLTRRKLMGQLPWIPYHPCGEPVPGRSQAAAAGSPGAAGGPTGTLLAAGVESVAGLLPLLRDAENGDKPLEHRLRAASEFSTKLGLLFLQHVTETKGRLLSEESEGAKETHTRLLDLISIRVRGMSDRLSRCVNHDFLPALEAAHIHLQSWSGLTEGDRRAILDHFEALYLPEMTVAPEWGPSFVPEMPPAGCAVGLMVRNPKDEATRFFHLVLGRDTPSFLTVPGTTAVLPLEEVVRGHFLRRERELGEAETFIFRFTTGEAIVREPAPPPEIPEEWATVGGEGGESTAETVPEAEGDEPEGAMGMGESTAETVPEAEGDEPEGAMGMGEATAGSVPEADAKEDLEAVVTGQPELDTGSERETEGAEQPPSEPEFVERRQSIVARVLVQHTMPESAQAQLLRSMEGQVTCRDPLIGWSDLYAVHGPLDLTGLHELLRLRDE